MKRESSALALIVVTLLACEDKAKPKYSECVAAEAKGDVLSAASACEAAVTVDATSTSGKAAAEKLRAMQPAVEKAKKEKAEADAKAAEERRRAEAARQQAEQEANARAAAEARKRVRPKYWGFEPNGECTARGLPPFRKDYEGGTLAEDQMVAFADGCQSLYPGRSDVQLAIQFCCPK